MRRARHQQRTRCSHCHETCRVEPFEVLTHGLYRALPVWHWVTLTLCPPCRVAFRDWWRDPNGRLVAGHP